ncbi:unnamed protein product [Angiostrongylus costaricensis]|uniref:Zf-C5HC2 domain-containing protein n=1 Tax=Angiostrongylus costaricensis TaxID=334426 RepID=A0A0R3PPU4_ANGCS|nr:unnamed protein product [Angiostrongylus costaricensis]
MGAMFTTLAAFSDIGSAWLRIPFTNHTFLDRLRDWTVECVQCVQLWRSVSPRDAKVCGPHAKTCKGSACFMRQCKHCPVYQYMSGCVDLTPWQIADLEVNRRRSELRMRRVGAVLLCEDTFNQTTCICNRRDKCNSIHARLPFSTYSEGIFKGVVNFDQIIADLDPR